MYLIYHFWRRQEGACEIPELPAVLPDHAIVCEISPPLAVLEAAHKRIPGRRSPRDAGHMMWTILRELVSNGLKFGLEDFRFIDRCYQPFGAGGLERTYALACGEGYSNRLNISAARSIEKYLDRPPFMYFEKAGYHSPKKPKPLRAAVGTRFWWPPLSAYLEVTSFGDDHLVAVKHKRWEEDPANACARAIADEALRFVASGVPLGATTEEWTAAWARRDEVDLTGLRSWEVGLDHGKILKELQNLRVGWSGSHRVTVEKRVKITREQLRKGTQQSPKAA